MVVQVRELEAKAEAAQAQRHDEVTELEGKVERLRTQRDQDITRLEDEVHVVLFYTITYTTHAVV